MNTRMNLYPLIIALITGMFFLSGIDKLRNLDKVTIGLQNRANLNLPYRLFWFAILVAGILEVVAPSIMMYSAVTGRQRRAAYLSAVALAAFTVVATYFYHFPPTGSTYYPFVSNVTTAGALLLSAMVFRNGCNVIW